MITVKELNDALAHARSKGVLRDTDVLVKSPRTGNLAVLRNSVYTGHIDVDSGEVYVQPTTIKGVSPQFVIIDEISAFLEEPDVAETGHKRDEDVDGPPKPYIQRGEGI